MKRTIHRKVARTTTTDPAWEGTLKNCPCCGGKPLVVDVNEVKIACGKFGCMIVEACSMKDAAELWNAKDFRYARHD